MCGLQSSSQQERLSDHMVGLGIFQFCLGNLEQANMFFQKAISLDPTNISAYFQGGRILFNFGPKNWKRAAELLEKADCPEFLIDIYTSDHCKNPERALELAKKLFYSSMATGWQKELYAFKLALAYDQNEQKDKANEMYELALQLYDELPNPGSCDLYFKGCAYRALGELEKAKEAIQSIITDNWSDADTHYVLMSLLYEMKNTFEAQEKAEFLIESIQNDKLKEDCYSLENILKEARRILREFRAESEQ